MVQPTGRRRGSLRTILVVALVGLLVCCGGAVAVGAFVWNQGVTDTVGEVEFGNRLAIPPLAESHLDGAGRRVFDVRAGAGEHDFGTGRAASTWGFNGSYLGPTLRASRGEEVVINVHNGLDNPTSVHWHGMHLPAAMDGGPHQPVDPDETWSPHWRIDQPAATLWYHPHPHGQTAKHVYRGLAGMFILDDPEATALALPRRYGVDDIPVIVQDKKFTGDELNDRPSLLGDIGILGDTIAVNGTVAPFLNVTTERVRLRVLNASNARTYDFGLSDNRDFALIGTDGGLLDRPRTLDRIPLSPGERAEIVVDVRAGERVVLRSYPPRLGNGALGGRFTGGSDRFDVLELRAAGRLERSPAVPDRLVSLDRIDPSESVKTRQFRLSGHSINGDQMEMGRIDFAATVDTTEVWELTNRDGAPHDFHVHDVQFQVLSVGGEAPPAHLTGWKDTVFATPNTTIRLAIRFTDYTDPDTPYMYHCHLLAHEDQGMMGQFVVVEPGQQAGTPGHNGHAGHVS